MATQIPAGQDVMNAIRNEASPAYQAAVPVARAANLQDVGNPILQYQSIQNEFLTALVNKIALTIVNRQLFDNPLGFLKKGATPLGLDVEEIYTNPAVGKDYAPNDFQGILTPETPDVKAAYFRRNRRTYYKATIKNEQLTAAFTSWTNLEGLIASIVDSLYNGNSIDEFNLTKTMLGDAVQAAQIQQRVAALPTSEATAKTFSQLVRGLSLGMRFPSTSYNNYALMGGTGNPVTTWSPADDTIIFLRSDVAANVDVQWMASAFNLSMTDYLAQQVIVDSFGTAANMIAAVGSRKAFQIRENQRRMTEFYNASVMAWTYWWHCWDTYALSPFHNLVAIVTAEYPVPEPPAPGG